MKNLIYLGLSIFLIAGTTTVEAQILKKLTKKVVEKKVDDETDKTPNNARSNQRDGKQFTMGMVDPAQIPESYDFDWEYTLQLTTTDGVMNMVYHIKEDASYVGIKIPQAENMFTVLDNKRNMTVMYMNSEGNKMVMATNNKGVGKNIKSDNSYKDMEFKKIGTKTILGHECQGYRSENTDQVVEFYVTDEAGVSFSDIFQQDLKNIPKGLDSNWFKDGTGLLMEMQMEDKKNPKKNVSMICTGIEKKPFSIKTSEYQSMGMGGR